MATSEDQTSPDLSEFPDAVLVNILLNLSLSDRANMAQTCHRMNDCFNHPSLWYKITMDLLGTILSRSKYPKKILDPKQYYEMTDRFGKFFQDVTLIFHGDMAKNTEEWERVITTLTTSCRLKALTLEVGCAIFKNDLSPRWVRRIGPRSRPVQHIDLKSLVDLIRGCTCLKSFTLRSWPLYPGISCTSALSVLKENHHIRNLEKLSLYWLDAQTATWASNKTVLPGQQEMLATATHFTNLTSLALRSPMMSRELIEELARPGRAELKRFGILVIYSSRYNSDCPLPNIPASAWTNLSAINPDLKVDITVVTRIPNFDLFQLLVTEIPVTSINFMKYSRCNPECLLSLTDKYHRCLRKFVCFADNDKLDTELQRLVETCTRMDYFVYSGSLFCDTVLQLAKLRSTAWYCFHVNPAKIRMHSRSDYDEDKIAKQSHDGSFYLTYVARQLDENMEHKVSRSVKLKALFTELSQIVGKQYLTLEPAQRKFVSSKVFQTMNHTNEL